MGWIKDGNRWWYQYPSGGYPRSKWEQINGKWYHFDSSGWMQTGWLKAGGKTYYLSSSGARVTGWQTISKKRYRFDGNGVMATGWKTIGGKRYWFDADGVMYADGQKLIGGKYYRFNAAGVMTQDLSSTAGVKVTNLKIERDGRVYKGTWKVPDSAKKEGSLYRYANITPIWRLMNSGSDISRTSTLSREGTASSITLNGFEATQPKGKSFSRADFYPLKNRKVDGWQLTVKGNSAYVKDAEQSIGYNFKLPRKPTVAWEYDEQDGALTLTVKTDAGKDESERYDTMVMVEVNTHYGTTQQLMKWTATTSTAYKKVIDTAPYVTGLAEGKYVTFTARAYARGLKGDNPAKANAVSASRTIAIPSTPVIKSVAVSSMRPSGRITVEIKPGANTDNVKLQRRHGADGSWDDVDGAHDNGTASALYDSVGLAEPVAGEYIWYRLIATKDNFTTVGKAFRADALYTAAPTTASTRIGIVSLEMDPDGTGAKLVVGWTEAEAGIETEASWSTDFNAWESNEEPERYSFKWEDAERQSTRWAKTATLYVKGLEQGKTYYFKARRVYEDDVYSDYASRSSITPADEVTGSVSLTAPAYVVRGEPITAYWDYDGEQPQRAYSIHPEGKPKVSLAFGKNTMTSASIPYRRYGDADSITFYVSVAVGSERTDSNTVTVQLVDVPMCGVAVDAVCTAKPLSFEAYTDTPGVSLAYKVLAGGLVAEMPDGVKRQLEGDAVAVGSLTPGWTETQWTSTKLHAQLTEAAAATQEQLDGMQEGDDGYDELVAELATLEARLAAMTGTVYAATVTVEGADIIDSGAYKVAATITDQRTGLMSSAQSEPFTVVWAHQAPTPPDTVAVEIDEAERTARIVLAAPEGAAQGDVYDIYRGHRGGYDLIKDSLPLTAVLHDRWPAFGEQQFYRVVCRTVDGDIAWTDIVYSLPVEAMRFDWPDGSSETIHNIQLNDNYKKDFQRRQHLEGKGGGYWNGAVERTGSYSATAIKDAEAPNLEALGRHGGAAFCRTPEGYAFQCNVDVSRTNKMTSMLEDYSLSLTEVDLTRDFMPSDDDIEGGA